MILMLVGNQAGPDHGQFEIECLPYFLKRKTAFQQQGGTAIRDMIAITPAAACYGFNGQHQNAGPACCASSGIGHVSGP